MNKKFAISMLVVISLFIPIVLGAQLGDAITSPLKMLFGDDPATFFTNNAPILDGILFFWLFIALSIQVMGDKFKDSKSVPIVLGMIMGIGMSVFEMKTGFRVFSLWWLIGLIFFAYLGYWLYSWIKSMGGPTTLAFSVDRKSVV